MSRILVVEKTPNVQALLGKRFPTDDVFVDAMPLPGQALQKVKTRGYDILIWDAVAAGVEQSEGLELLDLVTSRLKKD